MGNLFGRKRRSRVTEQDRAVLVSAAAARPGGRPGRAPAPLRARPGPAPAPRGRPGPPRSVPARFPARGAAEPLAPAGPPPCPARPGPAPLAAGLPAAGRAPRRRGCSGRAFAGSPRRGGAGAGVSAAFALPAARGEESGPGGRAGAAAGCAALRGCWERRGSLCGGGRSQLKQQRDKLKQYQKRINLNLERERALARQLLKEGKREKAMLLLKKKRYQEQLLDKTENQISNLERMVQDIEFTQIEMKVIEGLKIGNECLNKMHQVMSIEEVERIIGETQDAVEYQRQIDEILAGSLTEEDEDAILEELNAITQVTTLNQLDEDRWSPTIPRLPEYELCTTDAADASPVKNRPKAELVAAS
ncbi:hypothetical protein QYF61_026911 [Mycteria americana]|uniref:Charged multivesicular body protein 6 n=1 Tax=Mycteria americana TaxID=33587 RepID=A0AAN7MU38_MYCAM|nr:hypothetical protein QYF61_026911 [Mycteria americana]